MPSKKKKYNARFPPARIKKIMQTDEEVGKVAAPVPVIISRALELFVESLLKKAVDVTTARNAKTLSPVHLKMCIMSENRFDFLKDLVASVPDIQGDGEEGVGVTVAGVGPSGASSSCRSPAAENKPDKPSRTNQPRGHPSQSSSNIPHYLENTAGTSHSVIESDDDEEEEEEEEEEDKNEEQEAKCWRWSRHHLPWSPGVLQSPRPFPSGAAVLPKTPERSETPSSRTLSMYHGNQSSPTVAGVHLSAPNVPAYVPVHRQAPQVMVSEDCSVLTHGTSPAPSVLAPNFYQDLSACSDSPSYNPPPVISHRLPQTLEATSKSPKVEVNSISVSGNGLFSDVSENSSTASTKMFVTSPEECSNIASNEDDDYDS